MKDIHVQFAGVVKSQDGQFSIIYIPDQRQVLLPGIRYKIVLDGLTYAESGATMEGNEPTMVWVRDTYWRKLTKPKRCRQIGGHPKTHCPNMADFGFLRGNGVWAYCPEHMYGRRIRDGIVEIQVSDDSPGAKQGYV